MHSFDWIRSLEAHVIEESSTGKGRQWNQEGDRTHSIDSPATTDACSSSKPPSILFIDSLHHNQCQLVNVCMVCWTWMCIIITRQEAKSNQDKTPGTKVDMREREKERERMQLLLPFLLIPFLQFSLPLEQSCSLCFEISVLFFPSGKNDSERKDFAVQSLQNLIPVVFLLLQSNRSLSFSLSLLSCLVIKWQQRNQECLIVNACSSITSLHSFLHWFLSWLLLDFDSRCKP